MSEMIRGWHKDGSPCYTDACEGLVITDPRKFRSEVRVMGIDPGLTVGWSITTGSWGAQPHEEFLPWLFDMLKIGVVERVTIERYHTRSLTPEGETTLQVIGGVKVLCQLNEVPFTMVNPADKKKTIKEVSEDITNRHARDAEAVRLWDLRYGKW